MTRSLLVVLALLLAACADDSTEPPSTADSTALAEPSLDAPMTFEDSAAVLQAQIDSLRQAIGETQAEIDAGFRETDSMRQSLDALGEGIEDTRRRIDENQAETDALLGQ